MLAVEVTMDFINHPSVNLQQCRNICLPKEHGVERIPYRQKSPLFTKDVSRIGSAADVVEPQDLCGNGISSAVVEDDIVLLEET